MGFNKNDQESSSEANIAGPIKDGAGHTASINQQKGVCYQQW